MGSLLADRDSVVNPGDGIGTLSVQGDFELERDATLAIDILLGDDESFSHDLLDVLGAARLDFSSMIELRFLAEESGDPLDQVDAAALAGRFLDVIVADEIALFFALPNILAPLPVLHQIVDFDGNRRALRLFFVPEPGTAGLLLAGLAQSGVPPALPGRQPKFDDSGKRRNSLS